MNHVLKLSKLKMLLDLIGKWLYPHQQKWQQRRSARTLLITWTVALVLGALLVLALVMMASNKKPAG